MEEGKILPTYSCQFAHFFPTTKAYRKEDCRPRNMLALEVVEPAQVFYDRHSSKIAEATLAVVVDSED